MSANSTKWQMVLLFKELVYKCVSSDKMNKIGNRRLGRGRKEKKINSYYFNTSSVVNCRILYILFFQ